MTPDVAPTPKTPTPRAVAMRPVISSDGEFERLFDLDCCRWHDRTTVILNGDAGAVLPELAATGVRANCVVTSPPYYGQRDYGVVGAIGLERDPHDFIDALTAVFHAAWPVTADNGSLWVNIGDTYWNSKGAAGGFDDKQPARRYGKRPQDYPGDGHWTRAKQLLLIPHRLAISLQDDGWLVRNDDIWVKPNPVPDPVRDRCAASHEHVFHFTKSRWYYFDMDAVRVDNGRGRMLPPKDTWTVDTARMHPYDRSGGGRGHRASYPERLLRIPIDSTTPENGIVLDPFMGSGTTLRYARAHGLRSIGIELNPDYCDMAADSLSASA